MDDMTVIEQRFNVLDYTPVGAFLLKSDFCVLFWNRTLEDWTEISKHEIIGKNIIDYYAHLKEAKFYERIKSIFTGGAPTVFSSHLHKYIIPISISKNNFRIQNTTVTPIRLGDSKEIYCLFVIQDVTDLSKRVQEYKILNEQALEEIKERFQAEEELRKLSRAVEQSGNAIVITNLAGQIEFVNPAFSKITGYSFDEVIGQNPGILRTAENAPEFYQNLWETISAGKVWEGEVINKKKNGILYWESVTISPVKNDIGTTSHYISVIEDITDRKSAEETLRLREQQLNTVISNLPVVLYATDRNGVLTVSEGKGLKTIGLEPGKAVGMSLTDFGAGNDELTKVLAGEKCNWVGQHDDIIFENIASPLIDENKQISGLLAIALDITERKQAEEALRKERNYLEKLSESIGEAIFTVNVPETLISYVNKAVEKIFGYSSKECLGHEINIFFPDHDEYIKFEQILRKAIEIGYERIRIEQNLRRKNGDIFQSEIMTTFLKENGKIIQIISIVRDITRNKLIEKTLQEQSAYLHSILHSSTNMAIIATDLDLLVKYFNPVAEKLFGFKAKDVIGTSVLDIHDNFKVDKEKFFQGVDKVNKMGDHSFSIIQNLDGEEIFIDTIISGIWDNDQQLVGYVAILQDVTERKQAEQAIIEARLVSEKANKAKSEFLANMSHEIRTPMNAILGFTEILRDSIHDNQEKHYLAAIESSGKTLLSIINDILDLSKVEAGKMDLEYKIIDLHSVFNEMKHIFSKKLADKGLRFIIDLNPWLPKYVLMDETRLRQIVINLTSNALKFTEVGYVKLSVWPTFKDNERIIFDLMFSVEDTGIGIPEDQRELIFGTFDQIEGQSQSRFGGTGLGLAITKRLVELMEGTIFVTGETGKGSVFHVLLKNIKSMHTGELTEDEQNALDIHLIEFDQSTILIAEDVQVNRDLLKGYLLDYENIDILEADNGKTAVEMARLYHPDLILLDLRMPQLSGYEVTRMIREEKDLCKIPIIAVTASAMIHVKDEIMSLFNDYLIKPVNRLELIIKLTYYLNYSINNELEAGSGDISMKGASEENHENLEKLTELVILLKGELRTSWNQLSKKSSINEIERFAKQIKELGLDFHYKPLNEWGEKMYQQAAVFDIQTLHITLEDFPRIINNLELIIHK